MSQIGARIERVGKIPIEAGYQLVAQYHYSKIMPRLTRVCYGGFVRDELVAMMSLGWGVRPLHTIRRLFPSLSTKDYFEIGKLCLKDEMPSNSESMFISRVLRNLKQDHPKKKLVYTWADGMLGKPGYIYQASNFLYGGYIWTDSYFSQDGEKIHPRTSQGLEGAKEQGLVCGHRPNLETQKRLGLNHVQGKQFRYVYFLCGRSERKRLLAESTVTWTLDYPKDKDLAWKIKRNGKWTDCDAPFYDPSIAVFNKSVTEYPANQLILFEL